MGASPHQPVVCRWIEQHGISNGCQLIELTGGEHRAISGIAWNARSKGLVNQVLSRNHEAAEVGQPFRQGCRARCNTVLLQHIGENLAVDPRSEATDNRGRHAL